MTSITINAGQLLYPWFILPEVNPSEQLPTNAPHTVELNPGEYHFQDQAGEYSQFTFRVTASGVDYDSTFDGFLSGRGGTTLTVAGLPITIDARYIGMSRAAGVMLVGTDQQADHWLLRRTVRLVPETYAVQQGSAMVSNFTFAVQADGNVQYDPTLDIAGYGFLAGNGTPDITFYGYPVLLDATALDGGANYPDIWNVDGTPAGVWAANGVVFQNLLPTTGPFQIQVADGTEVKQAVLVQLDGSVVVESSGGYYLSQDSFNGLTRVTVTSD